MKKIIYAILGIFVINNTIAADAPQPRVSIFSTSTDWEAVTGLSLSEYRGTFIPDSTLVKKGLVLYYLDGFPCYGLGAGVRAWIGPNGQNHEHLRIACVAEPTEIKFVFPEQKKNNNKINNATIFEPHLFSKEYFPQNKRYSVMLEILHHADNYFGYAFFAISGNFS